MRIRHRIPTVFSLYMVDVLCCALGCVILMWLTNLQASEEQTKQAGEKLAEANLREEETTKQLRATEQRAGTTSDLLNDTNLKLTGLTARLEQVEAEKQALQKRLTQALVLSRELDDKVKDRSARADTLEADLKRYLSQLKDAQGTAALVPELRDELKTTKQKLTEEAALALALEKEIAKRTKELTALNQSLSGLQDSKAALEKTVTTRDKDLAAARVDRAKWEAAEERVQVLEKQLTERQKEMALAEINLAALRNDKKTTLDEIKRIKNDADARFAGMQLTGKNVLFLVDMSGSMDLVDETTLAPGKWLGVRETLVKIMRSLPELEKFQVIIFSDKTSFFFGGNGDWIDYDPRTSSDRVFKALADIKPKGGTNMYSALEASFKLRAAGLDTIYFFSDGLPNMGEGLKPEETVKLTESQIGDILGKYIRRKLKTEWNRPLAQTPAVRINTIGFFFESPDVGAFFWALAREHDGSFVGMSKP